ncbi:hypothetical protein GCM10009868_18950 [Terrabacter aerolatus]|uniref:Uncharacterized protein n=2 Tax=Terrabacter aerolatus TaxID=422442 RepID=A0A512CZX0_9MICO|nr:hypothetical protein TAE01_15760 [Terrabacter aerolatus]
MPCRAVVVLTAAAVVGLLASCGATDIPAPRRTVTVTVDAPGSTSSQAVPTTTAPAPTTTPPAVPTALAAGKQRGAPKSFAEAKSRIDAAAPAAAVSAGFRSPTGNIVCRRGAGSAVACEVKQGRIPPPLPTICPPGGAKDIGRIELGTGGARPVCNTDSIGTGSEPVLGYGARTQPSGTTACLSESTGVTCIELTGRHGFFLARSTFVTF